MFFSTALVTKVPKNEMKIKRKLTFNFGKKKKTKDSNLFF